ncbi:TPA: hypothetical protein ENS27_08235 [bacterium]|nr:hypothetical protein [bacterium]
MKSNIIFSLLVSTFLVFLFFVSLCIAQETDEEDKTIDLPPVKIEIIDATQLTIPKERFDGLAQPDYDIYVALLHKERLWYLPSTSIPVKYKDKLLKADKDYLVMLSAYPGLPAGLSYQGLLMKGFGNAQVLLDVGRSSLLSTRTAKLASDHTKKQSSSTIDRFNGLFSFQTKTSGVITGLDYNAKDLDYLDINGGRYINDRSLFDISFGWSQRFSEGFEPSVNTNITKLMMEGPLLSDSNEATNVKVNANVRTLLSQSIPIDAGIKIETFNGNAVNDDFRDTLIKLYFNDRRIRLFPFILSVGIELAANIHKSSLDSKGWQTSFYPNPSVLLTSQIGSKTILQFGLERYILMQSIKDTYIKTDYVNFKPSLLPERGLELSALLKLNPVNGFTTTVGYHDRDVNDIAFPSEFQNDGGIIYWLPDNYENIHISSINAGWELLLLDGRLKQSIEYVHEFYGKDKYVPYRPENKGLLNITYLAGNELEFSLVAELFGIRRIGDDENLPRYLLWSPKVSKSFWKNAEAFISLGLYAGSGDYQILKGYALPKQTLDFGLSVRF